MSDGFSKSLVAMLRNNGAARYLTAPAMAGAGIAGVTLTTGNVVWGAYANFAAANAITTEFWIAGLSVYTGNANQVYQLQIYDTTLTTTKASFEADLTAGATPNIPTIHLPIPLYEAANTQIQGRAGGSGNGKTIVARLHYFVGV